MINLQVHITRSLADGGATRLQHSLRSTQLIVVSPTVDVGVLNQHLSGSVESRLVSWLVALPALDHVTLCKCRASEGA